MGLLTAGSDWPAKNSPYDNFFAMVVPSVSRMASDFDHGVLNIFPFPVKGSMVDTIGGVSGIGSGFTEVGAQ
jgi:hypothetical protein